jgi:hypothetical protein
MRLHLKLMIVTFAALTLLGTGPLLASPTAQAPDASDKDHSASRSLPRRASILLTEIQRGRRQNSLPRSKRKRQC